MNKKQIKIVQWMLLLFAVAIFVSGCVVYVPRRHWHPGYYGGGYWHDGYYYR